MTPEGLKRLAEWYDSRRFITVSLNDHQVAYSHLGELLEHATGQEAELARLRRVEEAARRLIKQSWTERELDNTGHIESRFCVAKGAWRALDEALDSK